ncbi:MAG: gliding motility-associated C-terminal domain-containing protein, partial [Bacteroidota bacterium]
EIDSLLCVRIEGVEVGMERACVVVCDDLGICDTTYLDINVIEEDGGLVANDDRDTTLQGGTVVINVLNNDQIPSNELDTFFIDMPPTMGTAMFNEDGTVSYEHTGTDCDVTDAFTYVICTATACDTALVEIYISCEDEEEGAFTIFDGFSPNDDGVNDFFTIQGIDAFPDHTLNIYNRWGNQVLNRSNYKNDWDGTWNNRALPDGTYFYIFDTGTGERLSGWIQIAR